MGILNNLAGNSLSRKSTTTTRILDNKWKSNQICLGIGLTSSCGPHPYMVSILSAKLNINRSAREVVNRGNSSFGISKTGPFITTSITAEVTAPGSHAASHTSAVTVAAQTTRPTTVPHGKITNSSTTTTRDNNQVPKTHKGIPSTEQYVPPTPLKVERLQVLLQHHPQ